MENLIIKSTIDTPRVEFFDSGELLIEGKSCPVTVTRFYEPLFVWVTALKAEKVNLNVNLIPYACHLTGFNAHPDNNGP